MSCAPDDGTDDPCPHNFFTTCTVISGTTHVLEDLKTHPAGLRTAEGRRRGGLFKLLVRPNDPDILDTTYHTRPYDPATIHAYAGRKAMHAHRFVVWANALACEV